jgi:hypothetical protein
MRAWQAMQYGDQRSSLRLNVIERPVPKSTEVWIKVYAVSLNPIDYKMLHGDLKKIMPMGFRLHWVSMQPALSNPSVLQLASSKSVIRFMFGLTVTVCVLLPNTPFSQKLS